MKNTEDKQEKKAFYKLVFALVIPMALQNLINVGVSSADVIMLGKVGETALSASSLAGQVQFIMVLIFFGLTSGACVLTAQYWGKGDLQTIEKVLGISLRFALFISLGFTVVVLLFPVQIMKIFSSEADVIDQGVSYLRIVAFSYVVMSLTMIYLNIMRSMERVIISTVVYLVSLVVNVIFNAIFIFGLFGIEPMGIRGAALGTLIARLVEFFIVIVYAKKVNRTIEFHMSDLFIKDTRIMKDFLLYAIPVMVNEIFWGVGTSANAAIIGHLGKSVVAANSVTQVMKQLAMVVAFGVATATAIILGKAIGEGKEELAKLYAKRLVRVTILLGLVGSGIILLVSQIVTFHLALSVEAKDYLFVMTIVMSYFAFAQAYNTTMVVGVFRAGGDTKFGLYLDMSTMWGCSILIGWLAAFYWKLPVPVVYVILLSDEIIKIPFTTWRYKSYKWVKNVTR